MAKPRIDFKDNPVMPSNVDKLNGILNLYNQDYKSDATIFMKAFPAVECWRFFIDGYRQDQGFYYDLANETLNRYVELCKQAKKLFPGLYKLAAEVSRKDFSAIAADLKRENSQSKLKYKQAINESKIEDAKDIYQEVKADYLDKFKKVVITQDKAFPSAAVQQFDSSIGLIINPEEFKLPIKLFLMKYPVYFLPFELIIYHLLGLHIFIPSEFEKIPNVSMPDVIHRHRGWLHFELIEPGYLLGVMSAQKYMLDLIKADKKHITVNFIKQLHKLSVQGVKNTNYDANESKAGEFRKTQEESYRSIALINQVTSLAGFKKLRERILKGELAVKICFENKKNIHHYAEIKNEDSTEELYNEYIAKSNPDWCVRLYGLVPTIPAPKASLFSCFTIFPKSAAEDFFTKTLLKYISKYEEEMSVAKAPLEKLHAIVNFIQLCEQAHLFADANCRTLCMNLLNFLLMTNGFPPAILTDPNRFDCYSVAELMDECIAGMDRALKITKGEKVFNVATFELLEGLSIDEIRYFEKAIQHINPEFKLTSRFEFKHPDHKSLSLSPSNKF